MTEDYDKIQNKWLSIAGSSMWVEQKAKERYKKIQERAYFIYMARKKYNKEGDAFSDWIQAEKEINSNLF